MPHETLYFWPATVLVADVDAGRETFDRLFGVQVHYWRSGDLPGAGFKELFPHVSDPPAES
jgi:hypothetical protein